ncbi:MAG: acyl-CoA thioesterase [Rhodospirillales bacterium]
MIVQEVEITAQFYDLDPMNIVWHGNYARFLEQARCVLLDKIGYNYPEMADSGYSFPIVELKVKYIHPVAFGEKIIVRAELQEWTNRIRIDYQIRNGATGKVVSKAQTTQLAVNMKTGETHFECPKILVDKVERAS